MIALFFESVAIIAGLITAIFAIRRENKKLNEDDDDDDNNDLLFPPQGDISRQHY